MVAQSWMKRDWKVLRYRIHWVLRETPPFFSSQRFHQRPTQSAISTSFRIAKMAHTNSFNTSNSYNNVWNNCSITTEDQSQILTWISPLEPRLRHQDIQDRRVGNIGKWLLQTEEFKSWCAGSGRGESDNAVLFCYGGPGAGKTYIR